MNCYENLVMKTQMNYSRHYSTYASGGTAIVLSKQKPLPYEEQIQEFVRRVQEAECIIVGGASGLSAAGGGDFYYSDTPSFREHFGKFADKYGFKGAFSGMMHRFSTRNEHWGYVAVMPIMVVMPEISFMTLTGRYTKCPSATISISVPAFNARAETSCKSPIP